MQNDEPNVHPLIVALILLLLIAHIQERFFINFILFLSGFNFRWESRLPSDKQNLYCFWNVE